MTKQLVISLVLVSLLTACSHNSQNNTSTSPTPAGDQGETSMTLTRIEKTDSETKKIATIEMENGNKIKLALYPELAPKTVENFLSKAKSGHYNGLNFHRVEPNDTGKTWVVQGGDPSGNGSGGGDQAAEYNNRTFKIGSLGIARGGDPNINNDSQFFITTQDSSFLDKNYTNFGDVTEGMDKVLEIKIGDKIKTITVEE
jgi:peptidyl-prolyl cis-trans isomerase B (cyclophilin B)